jgi:predicted ATP-grasp superfamily ATP-dependent carboligase
MMNFEEHIEMFIGTYANKNRVVEIDIFRRALYAARVDNAENLSPEQITVDTPLP